MRERRELGCGGEPLLRCEPPALGRIVQRPDRPRVRDQITGAIRATGKGRKGLVVVTKTPQALQPVGLCGRCGECGRIGDLG